MKKWLLLLAVLLNSGVYAQQRIAVLSPDVADIVVALGSTKEVVGRDQTTKNPALKDKAVIGVFRQLTVEPIVAVKPTIAIGSWMVQPESVFASLKKVGIPAVNVASEESVSAYVQSIRTVGKLLGKTSQADALAGQWQANMKQQTATGKRFLFSYDGKIVAGRGTAADEIIKRAGGVNAAANIEGLKPLNREAWIQAKPDIILIAKHHEQMVGGVQGMKQRAEVAVTPAGKTGKIYFWEANDLFRYGLDTPNVVKKLNALAK